MGPLEELSKFLKIYREVFNVIKKETLLQVFSYQFYEIFKNIFLLNTSSVCVLQL